MHPRFPRSVLSSPLALPAFTAERRCSEPQVFLFAFEHTGIEALEGQMEIEAQTHIKPLRDLFAGCVAQIFTPCPMVSHCCDQASFQGPRYFFHFERPFLWPASAAAAFFVWRLAPNLDELTLTALALQVRLG